MSSPLHPESEYYLHTNGTVHYKPHGGVEKDAPFVKEVWNANFIGRSPREYLEWLKELQRLGAKTSEVERLIRTQYLTAFIPNAKKELGLE